jgi:GT2 family glycosyltransferase
MTVVVATVLAHGNEDGVRVVLDKLAAQRTRPAAVVVVDNGSPVPMVLPSEVDGLRVEAVRSVTNLGVGGGHNLAIRTALDRLGADVVWILEHDSFPEAGCLAALLAERARHDEPTVTVPDLARNNYERAWPSVDHTGERLTRFTFNGPLIDRPVVEQVGWINEDFFVGQEDWDYSQRVVAAGFGAFRCSQAMVLHATKGDGRFLTYVSPTRLYYSTRNLVAVQRPFTARRVVVLGAVTVAKAVVELVRPRRGPAFSAARWWAYYDGVTGRLGPQQHRCSSDR